MDGTAVAGEPLVHLVGYGPSASTIGANRAGQAAARRLRACCWTTRIAWPELRIRAGGLQGRFRVRPGFPRCWPADRVDRHDFPFFLRGRSIA